MAGKFEIFSSEERIKQQKINQDQEKMRQFQEQQRRNEEARLKKEETEKAIHAKLLNKVPLKHDGESSRRMNR